MSFFFQFIEKYFFIGSLRISYPVCAQIEQMKVQLGMFLSEMTIFKTTGTTYLAYAVWINTGLFNFSFACITVILEGLR